MKKMIMATLTAAGLATAMASTSHEKLQESATVAAGAAVGRRVCSLHPEESVWLYDGKTWDKYPCKTLVPIFQRNDTDLVKAYVDMQEILQGRK